jgi:hypothetical protein
MVNRNSREECDISRSIEKSLPHRHGNYRGEDSDEICRRIKSIPCRFCGMPMTIHDDHGDYDVWRCWSIGCPNNIDQRLKVDARDLDIKMPNNPYRRWNNDP